MNYWIFFFTGLTTGGLACLAVQGGLLAGVIANQKEHDRALDSKDSAHAPRSFDAMDILPVVMFLVAKLIIHTIFGFFLGWLGTKLTIGLNIRLAFQLAAALFMFATAMNLLNVSPVFRFLAFQPPRFLQRYIRKSSKRSSLFAPAFLGFLTIFIPCGVTQAMEVVAVTSGSPVAGALIMFFFVLGTSPLFTILGVLTSKLSEMVHGLFQKAAAILLIGLALYSINGILNVLDSPITFSKAFAAMQKQDSSEKEQDSVVNENGVQRVHIDVLSGGYSPSRFTVKQGIPVQLDLESKGVYSCAVAFTFRAFNINVFLDPVDQESVTFTPEKTGKYTYSCSMGMYTGVMEVI
ncbi:MAG: sulfite exporter TauE/SafE family protein [Patescibacteria group bacterium]